MIPFFKYLAIGLVTAGLVVMAPGVSTADDAVASNTVSGEAYGVFADGLGVTVGKTPRVILPSDGGMDAERVLGILIPGVVASDTLAVVTTGAIGADGASAQSTATVENVSVLDGVVTARLIVAQSSSRSDGSAATSDAEGSTFIDTEIVSDTFEVSMSSS